jgi:glycine betaine/proline transport system substrate-binding protein
MAASLPGEGVTVRPVNSESDNDLFIMFVAIRGLEKLGYKVAPTLTATIPLMHVAVGQGDADFCTQSWTPLMNTFYDAAGGDKTMERVGSIVTGAAQGYLIDKATADAHNITNISQLKDPSLAALFDSDGDGKANLTGCNPGWGCERVIEHQLDAYALRDTVHHDQGEYQALIADVIARYQSKKPVLYYTWTPLWVGGVLVPGKDVTWLEVPFSSLPDDPNANTKGPDGKDHGFGLNDITIIVNKDFAAKNPAAVTFLRQVRIPLDDVNAENLLMQNGEKSIDDIWRHADKWIADHQSEFDGWVAKVQ